MTFLMLCPNNTPGLVEPWLCVKAHFGGDDGGKGAELVGSVCLPSCPAAHSGLIAQVPHTFPLTYCSVVVCVQSDSCIPQYFTHSAWLESLNRWGKCDLKLNIFIALLFVCHFKDFLMILDAVLF